MQQLELHGRFRAGLIRHKVTKLAQYVRAKLDQCFMTHCMPQVWQKARGRIRLDFGAVRNCLRDT